MQQTITAGSTVSIVLNMIDNDGSHVSGNIDTSATRLQKGDSSDTTWNSVTPSVDTITTGVFRVHFTGVSPEVAVANNDDRVRLKVNGTANGVAFTEYHMPLTVIMANDSVQRLETSALQIIPATVGSGALYPPTTTGFLSSDITESTSGHYNSRIIIFTSGALNGQAATINDYSNVGGSGQFIVSTLTEAPLNNNSFIIV